MTATTTPSADRSAPRALRRAGNHSRDGRGRSFAVSTLLHYGFRPFFFLAALYAGLAIPLWLWMYHSGYALPGPFSGLDWHVHEMLFGYLAAVIAGFVLTAIPNWTGRLPLSGVPLAGLVVLWTLGRLASAFVDAPVPAMVADLAFPAALAGAVWREVIAGRNWRNAPIAIMLTLFGIANAAHHGEGLGAVPDGAGIRMALAVIAMLMALIGGRIVPSFTRNWLARRGAARLPASFAALDKAALAATAVAVVLWAALPDSPVTGFALVAAGGSLAIRLSRWQGPRTWREPILAILHLGYGWLAAALALLGLSILIPAIVPGSSALHALTAGAVGTMTLAVMTRATLGHTGRATEADAWTVAIYGAVTMGAVLRVAAPVVGGDYYSLVLICGGGLWSGAFLLFAARFGPMLFRPRLATPG
jgi:uncharacterized protein involved in response to NO